MDSSTTLLLLHLDWSISNSRVCGYLLSLQEMHVFLIEIPVFNANSVDPGEMMHSLVTATDLGLHCFPITLLGVSPTEMG